MIGLFFFIKSEELVSNDFLIHAIDLKDAEDYGDMKTDVLGHDKLFESTYPNYSSEYYDFPRGRIVYDTVNDEYTIYIDQCIRTKTKIEKLKKLFGLKNEKVKVDGDLHYVCKKCQREGRFL